MILTGWRIAQPEFSKTPEEMLSGEGAYLYGGRWNSAGVRVVYLGTSLAQAALELLVHLDSREILNTYHKLYVSFDVAYAAHIDVNDLPDDWAMPVMSSSVREVGDRWVQEQTSLILQVPSAAIRGEYNYLLNPAHPDMDKLMIRRITEHQFDPRLKK